MMKAALASALVLAAVGVGPVSADTAGGREERGGYAATLTEAHIAQARAALRLTPAQERHWPRVAAALRAFIQRNASGASVASQVAEARRVIAAARPLLRALDAEQKQTARSMVRSMGFGYLAAAL